MAAVNRIIAIIVLVAGCNSSPIKHKPPDPTLDEVLAAVPPEIPAKLDRLAAIAADLPNADRKVAYSGAKLELVKQGTRPTPATITLIHAEDLVALEHLDTANVVVRVPLSNDIQGCWALVKDRRDVGQASPYYGAWMYEKVVPYMVEKACDTLATARHLGVIEETAVPAVAQVLLPDAGVLAPTFEGGAIKGTVLVFDLATGKYEGAIPFAAESSEVIEDRHERGQRGVTAEELVGADLSNRALDAVERALSGSP